MIKLNFLVLITAIRTTNYKYLEHLLMSIKKVNIENYKCFEGKFSIDFNHDINILVGNNETGKSTILEAINLALSGVLNGKYLKNELSQYLFNGYVAINC
jgi:putative ATP-dependent endonuclease of OLD family